MSQGTDAGKKIMGRKRSIAIDTAGALFAAPVTAVSVQTLCPAPSRSTCSTRSSRPPHPRPRDPLGPPRSHELPGNAPADGPPHDSLRVIIQNAPAGAAVRAAARNNSGARPHDGSRSSSTRADSTVHSRSGLTYQAGQLEKAGLIRRVPSPDDERSVLAVITDAGRDTFARGLPGHLDVVDKGMFSVRRSSTRRPRHQPHRHPRPSALPGPLGRPAPQEPRLTGQRPPGHGPTDRDLASRRVAAGDLAKAPRRRPASTRRRRQGQRCL